MAAHKTIMIVEDEATIAMELEDAVSDLGWSVIGPFARVSEAMASLDKGTIDAAILDMQLVDGDVIPFATRLEAAGIPFVVYCGADLPPELAERWSGLPVMAKPVPVPTLLSQLMLEMSNRPRRDG